MEHEPAGKAASEIAKLFEWLSEVIGLPVERGSGVADDLGTVVAGQWSSTEAHV